MSRGSYTWAVDNYGKPCLPSTFERVEIAAGFEVAVAAGTVPAWQAFAGVLFAYRYPVRRRDTGSYSCRPVTGGTKPSRHAHALAVDVNWSTNPYVRTPTLRPIRWGVDTDMPAPMISEIEAITVNRIRVFEWGGRWRRVKDPMHFQIRVTGGEISEHGVKSPRPFPIGGHDMTTLRSGDRGKAVAKLQTALLAWRSDALAEHGADGDYGAETAKWVETYQRAAELPRVTFGVADPATVAFILSNLDAGDSVGDFAPRDHRHSFVGETGGLS